METQWRPLVLKRRVIYLHSCSISKNFQGETVVDLGSGGGIDVFLAADKAGPTGQIIGIDMSSVSHLSLRVKVHPEFKIFRI